MRKGRYAKKLEAYAASLDGAHEAFVLAMWMIPQKHGTDEKFWAWVDKNKPNRNDMSVKCYEMAIARK